MSAQSLAGKKIFITGASRGIGLAIAKRAARDGAMIAIAAKTTDPHPKLPGTIFTAAEEIEHRDEALERGAEQAPAYRVLSAAIGLGCRIAIAASERV